MLAEGEPRLGQPRPEDLVMATVGNWEVESLLPRLASTPTPPRSQPFCPHDCRQRGKEASVSTLRGCVWRWALPPTRLRRVAAGWAMPRLALRAVPLGVRGMPMGWGRSFIQSALCAVRAPLVPPFC